MYIDSVDQFLIDCGYKSYDDYIYNDENINPINMIIDTEGFIRTLTYIEYIDTFYTRRVEYMTLSIKDLTMNLSKYPRSKLSKNKKINDFKILNIVKDYINWNIATRYKIIDIDNLLKFRTYVNWGNVSKYYNLSESDISKICEYMDWYEYIVHNISATQDILEKYFIYLPKSNTWYRKCNCISIADKRISINYDKIKMMVDFRYM